MSSLNELRDFALLFGYQADNILFRHTHTHTLELQDLMSRFLPGHIEDESAMYLCVVSMR